jgi:hypothetical protein
LSISLAASESRLLATGSFERSADYDFGPGLSILEATQSAGVIVSYRLSEPPPEPASVGATAESAVSAIPNPASSFISLDGNMEWLHNCWVRIFDYSGQTVLADHYGPDRPIMVESLANGIYLLHCTNGHDIGVTTFCKVSKY